MKNFSLVLLLLAAAISGCGDNMETPPPVVQFAPPTGLKALSVDQSTVQFQWSASQAAGDSTFAGYVAQIGGRIDTLPKTTLSLRADSLAPGTVTFSVYSLRSDGLRSDPAITHWAPASRFDSAYTVYERTSLVSSRPEGFNVGTSTTDPSTMVVDLTDPVVQQTMDLFFNGDTVETEQSLSMWSANLLLGSLNATLFSTQSDASSSLDFPLSAFPSENTFVRDSVAVADNTIYYAKVIGDPQQVNYARIHVHIRPGTFPPNRIIEIRVSLQRVPGLLFAFDGEMDNGSFLKSWSLYSLINYHHS